ncbi:baseplate J/gp47 family protein [Rhizobium rosettiformans]|uniref:Baseplate J/gp47 family protein n=2 Tax=Rhizobium TaxID=379 RepID=A0ABX7ERQ3_9HYPH|nr:baseplate J/gp47 family protein [Rhizobium rosettiformans]QRF49996.1 baseplate J/gp47 family protein [Rhizobium rosettiformans]
MVWPIPRAQAIFERIAAGVEAGILTIRSDADPRKLSRAVRNRFGVFFQVFASVAPEVRELHDHIAWWARQYMPDSADDETMIRRHAGIWGVDERGAIKAVGAVLIEGAPGTVLPSGIALSASDGILFETTAGATISGAGVATMPAIAVSAGASGNLPAGVQLSTVAVVAGITRVTVSTAFLGGADEMTPEEIKAAYLQRIRQPAHGGAGFDYPTWVREVADALAIKVIPEWIGRGSLAVVVIMRDDDGSARVPTTEEIDRIQAHLGEFGSLLGVRPVTARVIVVPGVLTAVPISVRLRPDVASTRSAVEQAFNRFIATIGDEDDTGNESPIGATIEPSRISEAISAADGEYAHDLTVPADRYTLGSTHYPIPGTITWVPA